MNVKSIVTGAAIAVAGRALLPQVLLVKFRRDVKRLNAGDRSTLLDAYADDAVLRFHDGDHRWAGDWVGKAGIDRFLQNFTAAKVQGEIKQIAISGAPWALTMMVRFDDHADGPDGARLYENRTVLVMRTRWGKVVDHEDFYADTGSILAFDRKLTEMGVAPVPKSA
ncbi:MAG TPA: nuclear transport factor 2 family protein [Baekduia sp.]|uniref:nuclear transport factor 2 family protein n=1 Tax=Baekduia sp. TaxID=2600305 RepID=UPI002C649C41|nr:nuclear transport factor 2 family protein [Baekduia sp.]HMJ36255.1 nuclear transport factor 2 family protein [Baekduia sp.]